MSLTQSFISGWAVERVIPSLPKKTQNNVSRWFFTNAVTVVQGLAYLSLINNQNMTFNLLEFEIETNDTQHFKEKN